MKTTKTMRAAALAAALTLGGTAQAGLLGMDVDVIAGAVSGGTAVIVDSATVTVGAGVELPSFAGGALAVDLDDESVGMVALTSVPVPPLDFVGLVFDWDATLAPLDGLDGVASDILGFDPSRVILNPSPYELAVDFAGLPVAAGNFVLVDLRFAAVPEPAAPALLLAGAGALWWQRRKHRRPE